MKLGGLGSEFPLSSFSYCVRVQTKSTSFLEASLPDFPFYSQLILHSRNFGSFAAIRTGLRAARGEYFGVITPDLQESPELLVSFLEKLIDNIHDVVVGVR